MSRLLSRRRLILILDLDHTLLNSVHMNEVGEDVAPRLAELQRREQVRAATAASAAAAVAAWLGRKAVGEMAQRVTVRAFPATM